MNSLYGSYGRQRPVQATSLEGMVMTALEAWPQTNYAIVDPASLAGHARDGFADPIECCSRPEQTTVIARNLCKDAAILALADAMNDGGAGSTLPFLLKSDETWASVICLNEIRSDRVLIILLLTDSLNDLLGSVRSLQDTVEADRQPPPLRRAVLGAREIEVARWLCEGNTSADIGLILGISENTVNDYIKSATQKLGSSNRLHFVVTAIRLGLIA